MSLFGIKKLRKAILGNSASDAGADSLRKCAGSERKHTPIVSTKQRGLFGAELARRKKGKKPHMKGITDKELESHLKESAGKDLPAHKGIDVLRDMVKGIIGVERPGHKYLKREPKAGGGHKYTYQEPGVMSQGDAVAGSLEDIAENWGSGFGAYGSDQATENIAKQVRNIESRFPNLTPLETRMLRTTEGKVRGALHGKKSEHDIHTEVLGILAHAAHAIRGFKGVKAPAANKGIDALRNMEKALRGSEKLRKAVKGS